MNNPLNGLIPPPSPPNPPNGLSTNILANGLPPPKNPDGLFAAFVKDVIDVGTLAGATGVGGGGGATDTGGKSRWC